MSAHLESCAIYFYFLKFYHSRFYIHTNRIAPWQCKMVCSADRTQSFTIAISISTQMEWPLHSVKWCALNTKLCHSRFYIHTNGIAPSQCKMVCSADRTQSFTIAVSISIQMESPLHSVKCCALRTEHKALGSGSWLMCRTFQDPTKDVHEFVIRLGQVPYYLSDTLQSTKSFHLKWTFRFNRLVAVLQACKRMTDC